LFDFVDGKAWIDAVEKKSFTMDDGILSLKTSLTDDNYLKFTVGDTEFVTEDSDLICRKLKCLGGVTPAEISFGFDVGGLVNEKRPAEFKIKSIDQKASDEQGKYKQTFDVNEYGEFTNDNVYPVVCFRDSYYSKQKDGSGKVFVSMNSKQTIILDSYSFTGEVTGSDVSLECDKPIDEVWLNKEEEKMTKTIMLRKEGSYVFEYVGYDGAVYGSTEIVSIDYTKDNKKPEFVNDEEALNAFNVALNNAVVDCTKGTYCPLGKNVNIPSMEDLVKDDFTSYEDLKVKLTYKTPSGVETVKNTIYVEILETGEYTFNLTFTDENGNAMTTPTFTFMAKDNAVPEIVGQKEQDVGSVGQRYYAYRFKVDAFGCSVKYTLKYNPDVNADEKSEGWVEIPAFETIDKSYEGEYSYQLLKAIDYNGELNFTPDKLGAYMIECSATSQLSETNSGSDFVIIRVEKEGIISQLVDLVKLNLWSYIFFGIGAFIMCCAVSFYLLAINKQKLKEAVTTSDFTSSVEKEEDINQ
jgi:hypothetical protein